MDENGHIHEDFMLRVKEVVDMARAQGLNVILDTHHEDWLVPDEAHEAEGTEKLCSLWQQIAGTFRDYDEKLYFEGMNEPRMRGTDIEWTAGNEEVRGVVNRLNEAFVQTVRATGGNNEMRYLLIAPYGNSNETEALEAVEIPEDEHLIVAIHAYVPASIGINEDGNGTWDANNPADTQPVDRLVSDIDRIFLQKGIPVAITEYGCRNTTDIGMRLAWIDYYKSKMNAYGIPCIWWDNGDASQYALFDRGSGTPIQQEMVKHLL